MNENRRFAVEEVANGFILKISELGSDKLLGRYVYLDVASLMVAIKKYLSSVD